MIFQPPIVMKRSNVGGALYFTLFGQDDVSFGYLFRLDGYADYRVIGGRTLSLCTSYFQRIYRSSSDTYIMDNTYRREDFDVISTSD